MALPELMLPSSLPDFRAGDYVMVPEAMYAPVPRQAGIPRKRRLFTKVPRLLDASLETNQTGLETFYDWHEKALAAGSLPFTAKLAKVGSGVEYWKAYILSYTAEHHPGVNNHSITVKLRLHDDPSDTPPTSTTLGVEFSAALTAYRDTPAYALSVEFQAGLEASADTGPLLFVEFVSHLYTEANGPQSGNPLDVEFFAHLEVYSGDLPSAALAVEFAAALEAFAGSDNPLAVEFSAGLVASIATTGYVASPGALSAIGVIGNSITTPAQATVQVRSDGSIYKRANTGAFVLNGNWYSPTLAGVGSGAWIRLTAVSGTSPSGPALGTALSLASSQSWILSATAGLHLLFSGTIDVATDPDMTNIVSSFSVSLEADNT
jgi:hypothetical protein